METPPCHAAGIVARQARSANVGPDAVDRAGRGDADFPAQRGAAIADAARATVRVIDIGAGNSREIGFGLQ